jgi:hypothetical protein
VPSRISSCLTALAEKCQKCAKSAKSPLPRWRLADRVSITAALEEKYFQERAPELNVPGKASGAEQWYPILRLCFTTHRYPSEFTLGAGSQLHSPDAPVEMCELSELSPGAHDFPAETGRSSGLGAAY